MNRRKFIKFILYSFFSCPFIEIGNTQPANNILRVIKQFVGQNNVSDQFDKIGMHYLKQNKSLNIDILIGDIFNNENIGNSEIFRIFIINKIGEDYMQQNLVFLDGWVFSKTEAQLCALYSLI